MSIILLSLLLINLFVLIIMNLSKHTDEFEIRFGEYSSLNKKQLKIYRLMVFNNFITILMLLISIEIATIFNVNINEILLVAKILFFVVFAITVSFTIIQTYLIVNISFSKKDALAYLREKEPLEKIEGILEKIEENTKKQEKKD